MLQRYHYLTAYPSEETATATPFFFYPLEPQDYAAFLGGCESYARYPLMAFFYLTHLCWDRCVGCFVEHIESPSAMLPWQVVERVLRDLAAGGTMAIKFAGREATVSPHLSPALELAAELGLRTVLITSGANLSRHASAIARACTHLRVSLNTVSPERHAALHRPTARALPYDERLKWVERIVAQRSHESYTHGATFLIRPETMDEVVPYARLCRELGLHYVRYTLLDEADGHFPEQWTEIRENLEQLDSRDFQIWFVEPVVLSAEIAWRSLPWLLRDPAVTTRVTIHADGKVNACQEGWRGQWCEPGLATYGNLHEHGFADIWTGPRRVRFLQRLSAALGREGGSMPGCERCKYDDLTRLLRWMAWHVAAGSQIVASAIPLRPAADRQGVHFDTEALARIHRHARLGKEYADPTAEKPIWPTA